MLQVKKYYLMNNKDWQNRLSLTYSPLEKALEKQRKTIEYQREKQVKALKKRVFLDKDKKSIASLLSKDFLNEESTYELKKFVDMENKLDRNIQCIKQVTRKRIK